MKTIITNSEQETRAWARKLSKQLKGGEVISLEGDLGAGKTVIVKGLAEGLGIQELVNSPTFVLMKVYEFGGRRFEKLVHVDAYRLDQAQDLLNIGIHDYLGDDNSVVVIEWGDKVKELMPKGAFTIKLKVISENKREIQIT